MNRRLREVYEAAWPRLLELRAVYPKVSHPLLVKVPSTYFSAGVRLMVVGQQTRGWRQELDITKVSDPIGELMAGYDWFRRGGQRNMGYKAGRSAFWRAAWTVQRGLNPSGDLCGFVWSNLVKVDQYKRRASEVVVEQAASLNLLPAEVDIARPQVVVFFTGPDYDARLALTFAGMKLHPVAGVTARLLCRLEHEGLPTATYRTYHPAFLNRDRARRELVLNRIVAEALATVHAPRAADRAS